MISKSLTRLAKMNQVFVQTLNPMTGKMEWKNQPEDYDYQQELARAAFADMLHDEERNKMYYEGLKAAIALKRSQGQPVNVLDIGTGTGLLSMMAAKLGADSITAIEEFLPMANKAQKIIHDNGFSEKIKLIRKRSTNVQVGPGLDMEQRANVLVTEVFDTELIGEGAIGTFNHAHDALLTTDCLVIPNAGRVFAQIVSSEVCSKWNGLHKIGQIIDIPPQHRSTGAKTLALHDLQLSQFEEKKHHFKPLSDPIQIFDFDFGKLHGKSLSLRRQSVNAFEMKQKLKCDAIFMWWELTFDPAEKIILSCAPNWIKNGDPRDMAWRDHWMQAIYYPISNPEPSDNMILISNHDEYSYWFDVSPSKPKDLVEMPHPQSGIHLAVSRTRLGQLNDQDYTSKLMQAVKSAIDSHKNENTKILVLSEQTFLPLIASKLLGNKGNVICTEQNEQFKQVLHDIANFNGIKLDINNEIKCHDQIREHIKEDFDIVVAEPSFGLSLLPWHNLLYWYALKSLQLSPSTKIMPIKAVIWTCPVTFDHLWKIRAPLNFVEGFDLTHFDEVIMNACDISDAEVEPEPLWEYPCQAKSLPKSLMEFDFRHSIEDKKSLVKFENLDLIKRGSGMVVWMEWYLNDEIKVNTGPSKPVEVGKNVEWNMHCKQGVHFFVEKSEKTKIKQVEVAVEFKDGEMNFNFATV